MTISFPRALPAQLLARLSVSDFWLDYMQEQAPTRGGLIQARDIGPSLWMCSFQSALLTNADYKAVDAWLKSLGGSLNPFTAYDVTRSYALAYPAGYGALSRADGGGAFDGTCSLHSVGADNVTVTLGEGVSAPARTLPSGFVSTIGDFVQIGYAGGVMALHQVVNGGTADANGVLSVEVRPHVRGGYPDATANSVALAQPSGKFLLVPKSVRRQVNPDGNGRLSFQGQQTLG